MCYLPCTAFVLVTKPRVDCVTVSVDNYFSLFSLPLTHSSFFLQRAWVWYHLLCLPQNEKALFGICCFHDYSLTMPLSHISSLSQLLSHSWEAGLLPLNSKSIHPIFSKNRWLKTSYQAFLILASSFKKTTMITNRQYTPHAVNIRVMWRRLIKTRFPEIFWNLLIQNFILLSSGVLSHITQKGQTHWYKLKLRALGKTVAKIKESYFKVPRL